MTLPRIPNLLRAALLLAAFAACGGSATPQGSAGQQVAVSVAPPAAEVAAGGAVSFGATVTGTANTQVTWSVQETGGGSVDGTGNYLAPATAGTFHVVARSVADSNVSGSAVVTVQASGTVYTLPTDRRTNWAPGVPGGVPSYTTTYATIQASTYGNGASDALAGIQNALNAAGTAAAGDGMGRVVMLSAGTFKVTGTIQIPSKVVLRGAGPSSTTLTGLTSKQFHLIQIGNSPWPHYSVGSTNLTVDAHKGDFSVTVASASGFAVGQLVLIDELTDPAKVWWHPSLTGVDRGWFCRTNRPINQLARIASIAGNVITFERPLHIDYQTAFTAQLTRSDTATTWDAGVEELRATGAGSDGTGNTFYNVLIAQAGRSWVKHIECDDMYGSCIFLDQAYRSEVRDSYLHDAHVYENGGFAYGFDLTEGSTDNLFENNISVRFNKVINARACGGGNVVAYNYADDGGIYNAPDWVETGLQASHYPTPNYLLFEGNFSFNADGDATEGNAIYITFFRNWLTGARRFFYDSADLTLMNSLHPPSGGTYTDNGNVRCAGAMRSHWWYSYVGNVLGRPSVNYSSWLTDDITIPGTELNTAIWHLGTWDQDYTLIDTQVNATMLRDGNFDYKSNSVAWLGIGQTGGAPAPLPSSLYLTSKPAFFGSYPWPWVDPVGATKTYTLPAKARYDAGTPNG
jgi:hypothetical protein